MAPSIVNRFDQLSASLRARLTPTGELRPAAGAGARVIERAAPRPPAVTAPVADAPASSGVLDFTNPANAAYAALIQELGQ